MLLLKDLLEYMKKLFPDVEKWGIGLIDRNAPKVIGLYSRKGRLRPQAIGGASYDIKSVTLLVHWGRSYTEAERQAYSIYRKLIETSSREQIGNHSCWFDIFSEPVCIDRDEHGNYEFVLDFDVYYRL